MATPICGAVDEASTAVPMTKPKRHADTQATQISKGTKITSTQSLNESVVPDASASDYISGTPEDRAKAKFREALLTRIRRRSTADGIVYSLDLRAAMFLGAPTDRMTLRCPTDPKWPAEGATTCEEATAKVWVADHYSPWLWTQVAIGRTSPAKALLTTEQSAELMIDSLTEERVGEDGTIQRYVQPKDRSFVSMLRVHIIPVLGPRLLTAHEAETVGDAINNLTVTELDKRTGAKVIRPASRGTKLRFKATLTALYKFIHPHRARNFATAMVAADKVVARSSTEVFEWEDESVFKGDNRAGALEPSGIMRLLVAAMFLDRWRSTRPNISGLYIPNTAHAAALQIALGARISEEMKLRWGHIIFRKQYVRLHNSKVKQVGVDLRAVPLQTALGPWLDDLRVLDGIKITPNMFVIRTDPQGDPEKDIGAASTIGRRLAMALTLAGLKVTHKETHGLRATFASHCDASPDIDLKTTSKYLGHYKVYGTSTDIYVRQMVELMQPLHKEIIQLPSPADIRAAVDAESDELAERWMALRAGHRELSDE